jgi:hypothetical protein
MNASRLQAMFQGMGSLLGLSAFRRGATVRKPYTLEELRAIRKRNGVSRPPAVNRARTAARG